MISISICYSVARDNNGSTHTHSQFIYIETTERKENDHVCLTFLVGAVN